jgi:hypothetical protein
MRLLTGAMAADRVIYGSRVGGPGVTQRLFFKYLKKRNFPASPAGVFSYVMLLQIDLRSAGPLRLLRR